MDQSSLKNTSLYKKNSEEEIQKHTNSVSVENIEKLTIRTKNGLVNGVDEEKCKSSKKNPKTNAAPNITKEPKRSRKGQGLDSQNREVDVSNSSIQRKNKNSHRNNKTDPVIENCVPINEIHEESEVVVKPAAATRISCSIKEDMKMEGTNLKLNQSNPKLNECSNNKSESKRKKNKSKSNKSEPNLQVEGNQFNLPKFDVASIINALPVCENISCELSGASSSSQLESSKINVLECTDSSSEFEKDLIESIKNIKLQQSTDGNIENDKETSDDHFVEKESLETSLEQEELPEVVYVQYESELQMPMIMKIIQKDLSEPYSIYTYRYFIHNWPKLCFLAMCEEKCVGAIVCKLDFHRKLTKRGYIAMLAVDKDYRKRRIGSTLVRRAIKQMIAGGADEVVLETEVTNKPALRLYEQLGFVRDKRLFRYYLNGVDALRLKLWLR